MALSTSTTLERRVKAEHGRRVEVDLAMEVVPRSNSNWSLDLWATIGRLEEPTGHYQSASFMQSQV